MYWPIEVLQLCRG